MGKSSSSRKKERSKTSSSQRNRRKSRNRKLKSKKLRHRHDSLSSSETDLESSTSVSSSSSEDGKRVGRSRSGRLKDAKSGKKRSRKRSHDRSYSPNLRKRKHSKRDYDCKVKSTYKKKKRRRDASVSATISDSLSCSTCREGSSSSSDSEIDRHRGRSGKRKISLGLEKAGRSRYRSKSHSSCSLCSKDGDYHIEVGDDSFVEIENNSRRLKSIIVLAGEQNKSEEFNGDEQQEEVTYHLDDHQPSFRIMDGKDEAGKRELDHVLFEASKVLDLKEGVVSELRNCVDVKVREVRNEGTNGNHGGGSNEYSLNKTKNECSGNIERVNGVDLESILRQRALENLRKFKGVLQKNVETPANQKVDNDNDAKQLQPPVSKSHHAKLPMDDAEVNDVDFSRQGENVIRSISIEENGAKSTGAIDLTVTNTQDSIQPPENLGKISDGSNGNVKLKQDFTSLNQEVVNDDIGQMADAVICSTTNRSNLVIAALRPHSKVDSHTKHASASQESTQTKPSISDMNVDETAQIPTQMMNNDDQNIGNLFHSSTPKPSSSLESIPGGDTLNKSGHKGEEGMQFEQKTMSVMRGGEMVQVNYKVYIPKRAPALSRRQLKR